MRRNKAKKSGGTNQVQGGNGTPKRPSLRLTPEAVKQQVDPKQGTVVSLLRRAIGPVLDGLGETTTAIGEAKRVREIARSLGDEEVEGLLTQELNRIADAARVRH